MFLGVYWGRLDDGLTASLGGLVFIYFPSTRPLERLKTLLLCCGIMVSCHAAGLLSSHQVFSQVPVLMLLTALTTFYCRATQAGGPPGSLFFVIAASIGASSPAPMQLIPLKLGLVSAGCFFGFVIALLYTWSTRASQPSVVAPGPTPLQFTKLRAESMAIGAFVGLALLIAQIFQFDNPYWVPVSCLAVIQGGSLREIWEKQLHRMAGTSIGLGLVSAFFSTPLDAWQLAGLILLLSFAVELTVARHYATAVMFITPLTILLADAGAAHQRTYTAWAHTRFIDTVIGCLIGLAGGVFLHRKGKKASPPAIDQAAGTPSG